MLCPRVPAQDFVLNNSSLLLEVGLENVPNEDLCRMKMLTIQKMWVDCKSSANQDEIPNILKEFT
jgi:hypothetical protein